MKHRIGFNRLGRNSAHRKAMTRNMLVSLFRHEKITTTKAKALAVRRTAEKMITRAKVDSVHNRRMIARDIKDKAILAKVFTEIGPRYKERNGGYTRVLKLGPRPSDAAEMVVLELVDREGAVLEEKSKKGRKAAKATKPSTTDSKTEPKAAAKPEAGKKEQAKVTEEEAVEEAVDDTVTEPEPAEKEAEE